MPPRRRSRPRVDGGPPASPALLPDVMTIEQLATYLDLAIPTLYRKVQAHEIPFTKVGNLLRFTRVSIDQWLARNTFTPEEDLYHQFARFQNRWHFQKWLEGRGVNWRELTEAQLAALAAQALEDLKKPAPGT